MAPRKTRKASTYTLDVTTPHPNVVCDSLKELCPALIAASGVDKGRAFVRFRCGDDQQARVIAGATISTLNLPFTLHTGYGVNIRIVMEHEGTAS